MFLAGALADGSGAYAENQIYREGFDNRQESASINNYDGWTVVQGNAGDAVIQNAVTYSGSGKSLELKPAEEAVVASRADPYGSIKPAWVEYIVKPGMGAQDPILPTGGIGAVTFSYSGEILAADGGSWVTTGKSFEEDQWYRVLLGVDLEAHSYDVYISPADQTKTPFVPDRAGLKFIDPAVNSLSQIAFHGSFKKKNAKSSYVDAIVVHFIQKVEIVSAVQEVVKGKPSEPIWIQLQNANAEPQTAFMDIELELRTSSPQGSFSLTKEPWDPMVQAVIPEGVQSISVYYKDDRQGRAMISVNEYPERGWEEAQQEYNVVTAGNTFSISTLSPRIAGEAFPVTITARDERGEVDETYQGTLKLFAEYVNPRYGMKVLAPGEVQGFQQGVLETQVEYPDCGVIEIVAFDTEDSEKSGTSGPVTFLPMSYTVQAAAEQMVGKPFELTVSAVNAKNEVTPNYLDGVDLEVVGKDPLDTTGGKLVPGAITGDQFQNGTFKLSPFYDRWGKIQIRAVNATVRSQSGISGDLFFKPKAITVTVQETPEGRSFFYIGEAVQVTVSAVDFKDQPIENFVGSLSLRATPELDLPLQYVMETKDQGKKTFAIAAPQAGDYVIEANHEEMKLSGKSPAVQVRDATVQVNSTAVPVGSGEIEIELVDENGNRIKDSRVAITVVLQEENPNGSSISSATERAVVFNNGVAKIDVTDLESETVTVIPKSLLGFKIRSGTITFGRIGKTGIGALMWWEVKDEREKKEAEEEALEQEGERITLRTGKRTEEEQG